MATIQHRTARQLMYSWHDGMGSPFYAAASSGLCASFTALALECDSIDDPKDRQKLLSWIMKMRSQNRAQVCVANRFYTPLPWVGRA